jgi:two-component system, LytTR family, response regulator LytT
MNNEQPTTSSEQRNNFIFVKSDLAYYRVDLEDIYFIESLLNYVLIHTKNNSFKTLISLKDMEKKLPEKDFARIHNSYIVRIDKIAYIKYPQLLVNQKLKVLQISATYKENLFRRLNII